MRQRSRIQSQILEAWQRCIATDYCSQRINSERSLQASIWSQLNQLLPKTRRLFIEPSVIIPNSSGGKRLVPDIVVCNTREVIAVVELKYQPKRRASFKKDVESLATIAKSRKGISISNSRFRGTEEDAREYAFSDNVLFVWAGVHKTPSFEESALFSTGHRALSGCYLQLHAVTQERGEPRVVALE